MGATLGHLGAAMPLMDALLARSCDSYNFKARLEIFGPRLEILESRPKISAPPPKPQNRVFKILQNPYFRAVNPHPEISHRIRDPTSEYGPFYYSVRKVSMSYVLH